MDSQITAVTRGSTRTCKLVGDSERIGAVAALQNARIPKLLTSYPVTIHPFSLQHIRL